MPRLPPEYSSQFRHSKGNRLGYGGDNQDGQALKHRGNKMRCYPLQNTCSMCNCHQTELLDQASKSQTPKSRTKKKKLLQETAESKPQTGVTFHWEDTPARRNNTRKHHCWLPEGKLAIFTSDLRTVESRPSPCPHCPQDPPWVPLIASTLLALA